MTLTDIELLTDLLRPDEVYGKEIHRNGTLMYGCACDGRLRGWLHLIYKAVSEEDHFSGTEGLNILCSSKYCQSLLSFNGALFRENTIALYSLWPSRGVLSGPGFPFDIIQVNRENIVEDNGIRCLIIGRIDDCVGRSWVCEKADGSILVRVEGGKFGGEEYNELSDFLGKYLPYANQVQSS